jgi:hypothetical protein
MSYNTFDGYTSPQADGYVHVSAINGAPIYLFDGHNIGFFANSDLVTDASQGVIFLPNSPVAPTAFPVNGCILFVEGGVPYLMSYNGVTQSAISSKISRQLIIDGDYMALQVDFQATIMEFTSSVSLTTTRNIVIPNLSGFQWTVFNGTTGAQSLQFIGTSGTGITVANGKRAIIYADGTNIQRVTPDT